MTTHDAIAVIVGTAIGAWLSAVVIAGGGCAEPVTPEPIPRERNVWPEPNDPVQVQAQRTALGVFRVTAYCPKRCCTGAWADGRFADGTQVADVPDRTVVAAPVGIAMGKRLFVEGVGVVTVRDRGGAITDGRLDIYFASHADAREWGVKHLRVWVEE